MELFKLISTSQMVAQLVTFMLLLFLLRIFAWKKLLSLLDERRRHIADELASIEKTKQETTQLKSEYAARIAGIDHERMVSLDEAKQEARSVLEEAKKNAHLEAQRILARAKEDIRFEMLKAQQELKERVVELTIQATENLIQEKVDDTKDRQIVKDFLDAVDEIE